MFKNKLVGLLLVFSNPAVFADEAMIPNVLGDIPVEIQKESPMFSFQGARAAFKAGKTPVTADITGEWMLVGTALNPTLNINGTDGYWPDGRMELPSWGKGYFRLVVSIQAVDDAFGKTTMTFKSKLIGLETGKVYARRGPYTGSIAESFEYEVPPTKDLCGSVLRCKMVEATGMFLCEQTGRDARPECAVGNVYSYDGFMRIPPPEKK